MKKAARGLVETRHESFDSAYDLAQSRTRFAAALVRAHETLPTDFTQAWTDNEGRVRLELVYPPPRRAQAWLKAASGGFAVLVAASVWVAYNAPDGSVRFLLPMVTVLLVLGFPFVSLAAASARDARESRIRKAVREAFAPPLEDAQS